MERAERSLAEAITSRHPRGRSYSVDVYSGICAGEAHHETALSSAISSPKYSVFGSTPKVADLAYASYWLGERPRQTSEEVGHDSTWLLNWRWPEHDATMLPTSYS